jgi:hypothetical protein
MVSIADRITVAVTESTAGVASIVTDTLLISRRTGWRTFSALSENHALRRVEVCHSETATERVAEWVPSTRRALPGRHLIRPLSSPPVGR